ncbi:hypothetical protein LguiB_027206 [Lonicera macranthoides]
MMQWRRNRSESTNQPKPWQTEEGRMNFPPPPPFGSNVLPFYPNNNARHKLLTAQQF